MRGYNVRMAESKNYISEPIDLQRFNSVRLQRGGVDWFPSKRFVAVCADDTLVEADDLRGPWSTVPQEPVLAYSAVPFGAADVLDVAKPSP